MTCRDCGHRTNCADGEVVWLDLASTAPISRLHHVCRMMAQRIACPVAVALKRNCVLSSLKMLMLLRALSGHIVRPLRARNSRKRMVEAELLVLGAQTLAMFHMCKNPSGFFPAVVAAARS